MEKKFLTEQIFKIINNSSKLPEQIEQQLNSGNLDSTIWIVNMLAILLALSLLFALWKWIVLAKSAHKNVYKNLETRFLLSRNNDAQGRNEIIVSIDPIEYYRTHVPHNIIQQKIPGIMTSIGIFGTFYGICQSLLNLTNAEQISHIAVMGIVDGMKTAFITSLAGIIASIAYIIAGIFIDGIYKRTLKRNLNELRAKFTQESPAYYMRSQHTMTENLNNAAYVLVDIISDLKKSMDPRETATLLKTAIAEVIVLELKPALIDISSSMKEFKEINKDLKKNNDDLGAFITKDLDSIFKSMEGCLNKTVQTIELTDKNLNVVKDEIIKQMNCFSSLEKTLETLPLNLKSVLESVATQLSAISITVQTELEKFAEKYREGLDLYLEKQGETLDQHLGKNADKLAQTAVNFETAMNICTQGILGTIEKQKEITERIMHVIKSTREEEEFVKSLIQDASLGLTEKLSSHLSIEQSISKNLESCEFALEKISKVVGNELLEQINQFSYAQKEIIENYQQEVDTNLSKILSHLLVAVNEIGYKQNKTENEELS